MSILWRMLLVSALWFNLLHADGVEEKHFSLGLHGFESLLGNYGFTASFKLSSHVSLSVPVEFYSFHHSLPGSFALRLANNLAADNDVHTVPSLSMYHGRIGFGARVFLKPKALASGFYIEPIAYGGLIRTTDFSDIEFDNRQEVISSAITAAYRTLPSSDHLAFTSQLNIGYQWVSEVGLMFQFALYGNRVFAPGIDSIFNASDRFFASNSINSSLKSRVSEKAFDFYHTFGTQLDGFHAGVVMDLGIAF